MEQHLPLRVATRIWCGTNGCLLGRRRRRTHHGRWFFQAIEPMIMATRLLARACLFEYERHAVFIQIPVFATVSNAAVPCIAPASSWHAPCSYPRVRLQLQHTPDVLVGLTQTALQFRSLAASVPERFASVQ